MSAKFSITVLFVKQLFHTSSLIAFFYCNSSIHSKLTLVLPLGTFFNTISCFSSDLTYLLNTIQYSRYIHQRGQSFLRSPTYTIQSAWTVFPVSGPSIVSMDNDSNWKDASTTNPATNLISNRFNSSTCSWLKPHHSNNTNEQLADIFGQLSNTFTTKQTPSFNSRGTKAHIFNIFSNTEPEKLNNFLF